MATTSLSHHVLSALGQQHSGSSADAIPLMSIAELEEVFRSAQGYAENYLVKLNRDGDRGGSQLIEGRVITPKSHKAAWKAYNDAGWLLLDAAPEYGGLGLPTGIACAVQEIFDDACPAFGMMPVPIRAGSRLLNTYGSPRLQGEWLPRLASGDWSATICISEPDAGSDVRRIGTKASLNDDGKWTINGEKCWISFGDQDLTSRIGHFLLAKTSADLISLFLVPDRFGEQRNTIIVRRIEEKLGLHLSPTCALGFEDAKAYLLGEQGRGLQQLFVMIRHMRLATAVQGAGIASRAYATAKAYAADRKQGGNGPTPLAIECHADIQRMLLSMASRLETLRGLIQITAKHIDLADNATSPAQKAHSAALTAWLLPIAKTLGGEVAFGVASDAIQVLGGAGYTREWPVEQALRDARVLTIFEGTTGIQAQDLLFRQLGRGDGAPFRAFLTEARATAATCPELANALEQLERTASHLTQPDYNRRSAEWGATNFLALGACVATGWVAAGLVQSKTDDPISKHLRVAGQTMLDELTRSIPSLVLAATAPAPPQHHFDDLL